MTAMERENRLPISRINLGMRDGNSYGRNEIAGNTDELVEMAGSMLVCLLQREDVRRWKVLRAVRQAFRSTRRTRIDWSAVIGVTLFYAVIIGVHALVEVLA